MQEAQVDDFEQVVLPHLHHAYSLARWLAGSEHDAEDIVQESCLRAFRSYRRFRGGDVRPWLLKIVRNTFYTWSRQNQSRQFVEPDLDSLSPEQDHRSVEDLVIQESRSNVLRQALDSLSPRLRELLVLRELKEMSYREISDTVGVPIGTVMSGLSRARRSLRQVVNGRAKSPNASSLIEARQ